MRRHMAGVESSSNVLVNSRSKTPVIVISMSSAAVCPSAPVATHALPKVKEYQSKPSTIVIFMCHSSVAFGCFFLFYVPLVPDSYLSVLVSPE